MQNKTTIQCPKCDTNIDVNEALYHQLENELKSKNTKEQKKLKDEMDTKRQEYEKKFDGLKDKEEAIKLQKENFEIELKKATSLQVKEQAQKIQKDIKTQLEQEHGESMELLQKELNEKSLQVGELNKSKIEIEKLKRENKEVELKIQADYELTLTKKLQEERESILKNADDKNELKFRQKEEQLKQLQEQLQIAQRKAEQGSMQLQGEVQELAIEEFLSNKYPLDNISEIKKGARGGDCIQTIHTRQAQNCGKIYYESKRAKDFSKTWIEKFKGDMREKSVDVGVLVTEVLPSNMERMGLVNGVWVCTFSEFKALCEVLRESIIKINNAKKSEENKSDKMSLLYGYLTSTEFSMQIEAIVEGFTSMQTDLEAEKRAMMRIWKQRDKQIDKVLTNTTAMYGSIKGIDTNAIANIKALQLPYSDDLDLD